LLDAFNCLLEEECIVLTGKRGIFCVLSRGGASDGDEYSITVLVAGHFGVSDADGSRDVADEWLLLEEATQFSGLLEKIFLDVVDWLPFENRFLEVV
jgi:hypothetical protein